MGQERVSYLRDVGEFMQEHVLRQMAKKNIPFIIVFRSFEPTKAMIKIAEDFNIPLPTHIIEIEGLHIAEANPVLLEEKMAPRKLLPATLLEIKGIGVRIVQGKSGVGKK